MTAFVSYQLKSALCLMVFTLLYYALFRRETFHRANRFLLLGITALSLLIPLLHLPVSSAGTHDVPVLIGAVTVYADRLGQGTTGPAEPARWLTTVYLTGVILFSLYLLGQLFLLMVRFAKGRRTRHAGACLVVLPENRHPFSFFHLVFMDRFPDDADAVLRHELAHVRQWHSLDRIFIQLVKILQWFNPFLFLIEKAIQETHEYLADASVTEQDGEADRYRLLLLSRVFGVPPGIFSFFNHSRIKNRMIMLTKQKSPLSHGYKYLCLLPVMLLLFVAISCQKKMPAPLPPPPPPPPPAAAEQPPEVSADTNFFVKVDKQAEFQGGDIQTFREWVQKNLVYPPDAIKAGIFGKVVVQFAVNENGKLGFVKVMRGVSPTLDAETIRVIKSSPDWVPAQREGKNVKQQFVIPVVFALQ
jgi:TonB family protein